MPRMALGTAGSPCGAVKPMRSMHRGALWNVCVQGLSKLPVRAPGLPRRGLRFRLSTGWCRCCVAQLQLTQRCCAAMQDCSPSKWPPAKAGASAGAASAGAVLLCSSADFKVSEAHPPKQKQPPPRELPPALLPAPLPGLAAPLVLNERKLRPLAWQSCGKVVSAGMMSAMISVASSLTPPCMRWMVRSTLAPAACARLCQPAVWRSTSGPARLLKHA